MEALIALNSAEILYKSIYLNNPSIYEKPIEDWKEFLDIYNKTTKNHILLPEEPPTYLKSCFMEENVFFPKLEDDVAIMINARYCPAFWHQLKFIKIVYVLSGNCWFYMNDIKIKLQEGAFCIVGPNVRQAVNSNRDDDIVINLLLRYSTFTQAFSGLLTEQGIMTEFLWGMLYNRSENMTLLYTGKMDAELQDMVLELYKEIFNRDNKSNLICKSMLMVFCGQVLRAHGQELKVLGNSKKNKYYIPQILNYIRIHMDTVTLPMLAAQFQMSEGYMSRYIKKETGQTFSHLLCEMRIIKAEEMLKNTDFSIDKIVEIIGYLDKSCFYRSFNLRYGMSPVRYRKRYGLMAFI